MKKKRNYHYSLLALSLLMVDMSVGGCGGTGAKSSDVAKHMTQKQSTPVAHIGYHTRGLKQKDFTSENIEWEYDNLEGLKIHLMNTISICNSHTTAMPKIFSSFSISTTMQKREIWMKAGSVYGGKRLPLPLKRSQKMEMG